jgi:tRNA1(Val) A37 N6-methylase TrmN6
MQGIVCLLQQISPIMTTSGTNFFTNLQKAVAQNTAKQGQTFLNTKTQDAITFLQLLTQKYDVAVANPPYTDSADFGPELKKFVEEL